MRPMVIVCLLALAGCASQAANMAYDDVNAAAIADKQGCARGDKELCLKFNRAQDKCRTELSTGSTSAAALVCKRLLDEGVIAASK